MKRLLLILCVGVFALAQTPIRHGDVTITADCQQGSVSARQFSGPIVETDVMVLRADKAGYHADTQEIVAHAMFG